MGHDHHHRCAAGVGIGLGPWKDPENGFVVVCLPLVCLPVVVCGLGGLGWVGLASAPVPSPSCSLGWGHGGQRHRGSGPELLTLFGRVVGAAGEARRHHVHRWRCAARQAVRLGPRRDPENGWCVGSSASAGSASCR